MINIKRTNLKKMQLYGKRNLNGTCYIKILYYTCFVHLEVPPLQVIPPFYTVMRIYGTILAVDIYQFINVYTLQVFEKVFKLRKESRVIKFLIINIF